MDKITFKFWLDRSGELEEDRNKWKAIAKRLANPLHDPNCEYAVQCSYCDALKEVEKLR
jgi:hypothetical protein